MLGAQVPVMVSVPVKRAWDNILKFNILDYLCDVSFVRPLIDEGNFI